ncbi:hypothetical protein N0V90_011757 [Kalmusia sp. IMI 367209]|nr:hypothetical protein N0V90_011757 [Kalmusia sp. IMI 367209]
MAEEAASVNLRILSPSAEVEGGVHLAGLPATTTVGELRQRIQDAVPSRPATDRMRLIYRGRVVANDDDTLEIVFGTDNIRESRDQSLHLVLRELPSVAFAPSPAPRSATAPPNPLQPLQGPPQNPLQAAPFRTLPEPRPNSQPQVPQAHHHHHLHSHPHHHHYHQQPPSNTFFPPIQQSLTPLMTQNPYNPNMNVRPGQMQPPPQTGTPASGLGAQGPQAGQRPSMGLPNLPNGALRTVRQEVLGPNGERWTVMWNNTTNNALNPNQQQPILPRPFPHPGPGFGVPTQGMPSPSSGTVPDQMLHRTRRAIDLVRQDMENVRLLLQPLGGQAASVGALAAANPPAWRVDHIHASMRHLMMGLDNVDRGLASFATEPLIAQNPDVLALQGAASELRAQAAEFMRLLAQLQRPSGTNGPVSSATTPPAPGNNATPAPTQAHQDVQSSSSSVPTELFILSSPQGPVGILFDQRGTYSTAPIMPSLPYQTFTEHFNANRHHVATIGRQLAFSNNAYPQNHFAPVHPNQFAPVYPNQQVPPAAGAQSVPNQQQNQVANQGQAQAQNQNGNPAQPAAAAAAAPAPAAENNRVDNIAGHLWLIFKLACFVYFFAGGGGWYRPIMICLIAGIVYLAQVGIFEDHFATVRQYLEARLPPGTLGNAPQPGNHPNPIAVQEGQHRRIQPDRNLSPEQAARRLQQQHRDQRFGWVRETMRTTERAFAIFVASLWPGIGERMVQAQEERVRAERAAEEERLAEETRRREEEEKRRSEAEEASKRGEKSGGDELSEETDGGTEDSGGKGKGKEKASVEDGDGEVD